MARQRQPPPPSVDTDREDSPVRLLYAVAGRFGALAVWYLEHRATGLPSGRTTDTYCSAAAGLARSSWRYALAAQTLSRRSPRRR